MTKVGFFLPDLSGGGAERVTLTIAGGLADRGHEVELVLGELRGPLSGDVPSAVPVVDLGCRRIGTALPALRKHLVQTGPAVVVSGLRHANVVATLATRGLDVGLVLVEHNTISEAEMPSARVRHRVAELACHVVYRWADEVVGVSRGVADDVAARLSLPPRRVRVLPNPVDYAAIMERSVRAVSDPWLGLDGRLVVAVGRLTEQKDFGTLLRAVPSLPDDVRLLILGEGELRGELLALAGALGISDRVRLPGFVANPYPFLARADVVAMSSRWEGLPTVLLEALPFAARIVSTDCPSGPREILSGGEHGSLVAVGDHHGLGRAIADALDEPPRDRSSAWERYDVSTVLDQYEGMIEELATRRRRPVEATRKVTSRR